MSRAETVRRVPRASAVRSLLTARWLPLAATVLSVVLALPALGAGWMMDDYFHRAILLERSRFRALIGTPSEMFRFFRGDPERTGRLMDLGLDPWWTYPPLKAEFLQALTVLTHRFDYALWPDSPVLMHAHSLFWLGLAVAATACFYRRMLGATWVAGLAALLYAVDDARGATVGFIANRNVLVAASFGVPALIAHDRARRDGSRRAAWLAPLLLAGALFSKEEGVGTCAYLLAYGLCVDPRGSRRGCLALWPYLVVGILWAGLRASWGYGVHDVGLYIDPLTDTERYLRAAAGRIPLLLLGQWSPIPGDLAVVAPHRLLWGVAAAVLGGLLLVMAPLLRRDRLARFWALGMLLATVPVSATVPGDRLLTFAGIGAAGLLAQFLAFVLEGRNASASTWWRVPAWGAACALLVVHAVAAPIVLPFRAGNPLGPRWAEERFYVRTDWDVPLEGRTVVIVNAPSPMHANYLVLRRELEGRSVPRRIRTLAPAIPAVTIRRLDERTLAVRPQGGYLNFVLDRIFRSERRELALGEQVKLSGMTVIITALTPDGRPDEATFRFDEPLESPSFVWLCFRGDGFEPFTPPAIGQEVKIRFDVKAVFRPPGSSS